MEIKKDKEMGNENTSENKFRGKNAHEIYNGLLTGEISAEEFSNKFYKASILENSSYTKRIKIKEAVEGMRKGDNMAILEIRKLIIRMNSNNK